MREEHLFRTPYAYQFTFKLHPGGGWAINADTFYEGEPWSLEDRRVFEDLSLSEATDVLLVLLFGG